MKTIKKTIDINLLPIFFKAYHRLLFLIPPTSLFGFRLIQPLYAFPPCFSLSPSSNTPSSISGLCLFPLYSLKPTYHMKLKTFPFKFSPSHALFKFSQGHCRPHSITVYLNQSGTFLSSACQTGAPQTGFILLHPGVGAPQKPYLHLNQPSQLTAHILNLVPGLQHSQLKSWLPSPVSQTLTTAMRGAAGICSLFL